MKVVLFYLLLFFVCFAWCMLWLVNQDCCELRPACCLHFNSHCIHATIWSFIPDWILQQRYKTSSGKECIDRNSAKQHINSNWTQSRKDWNVRFSEELGFMLFPNMCISWMFSKATLYIVCEVQGADLFWLRHGNFLGSPVFSFISSKAKIKPIPFKEFLEMFENRFHKRLNIISPHCNNSTQHPLWFYPGLLSHLAFPTL